MKQKQVIIQNKLGVHTRAAAKIVDTAKKFQSKIELVYRDRNVDGKSIMSVITLGAQKDNAIDIIATGEDEEEAMTALIKLVNNRFGEAE